MLNGYCAVSRAITRARASGGARRVATTCAIALSAASGACGDPEVVNANVFVPASAGGGGSGGSGTGESAPPSAAGSGGNASPPRTTPEVNAGSGGATTAPAQVPKVEVTPGEPVTADPKTWRAVPVEGTFCRDKKQAGFGINVNPDSKKLLIHLEGGGACFNSFTCSLGFTSWDPTDANLNVWMTGHVLLDRNGDSPFKDWNLVYVPYCTGDAHTGASFDGFEGQPQLGQANYIRYLQRVLGTFANVKLEQVILSGMSAGGFGAGWNWMLTQDAFGEVPVSLLDDSGPPFGPEYLSRCQQMRFAKLWNWQDTIHPACEDCSIESGDVILPLVKQTMKRRGNTRYALLSHDEDEVIKRFFAYGQEDCKDWDALLPPSYPQGKYPEALADLRKIWAGDSRAAMYVVPGVSHTFVRGDMAPVKTADISMLDWVKAFVEGSPHWTHVLP